MAIKTTDQTCYVCQAPIMLREPTDTLGSQLGLACACRRMRIDLMNGATAAHGELIATWGEGPAAALVTLAIPYTPVGFSKGLDGRLQVQHMRDAKSA